MPVKEATIEPEVAKKAPSEVAGPGEKADLTAVPIRDFGSFNVKLPINQGFPPWKAETPKSL